MAALLSKHPLPPPAKQAPPSAADTPVATSTAGGQPLSPRHGDGTTAVPERPRSPLLGDAVSSAVEWPHSPQQGDAVSSAVDRPPSPSAQPLSEEPRGESPPRAGSPLRTHTSARPPVAAAAQPPVATAAALPALSSSVAEHAPSVPPVATAADLVQIASSAAGSLEAGVLESEQHTAVGATAAVATSAQGSPAGSRSPSPPEATRFEPPWPVGQQPAAESSVSMPSRFGHAVGSSSPGHFVDSGSVPPRFGGGSSSPGGHPAAAVPSFGFLDGSVASSGCAATLAKEGTVAPVMFGKRLLNNVLAFDQVLLQK